MTRPHITVPAGWGTCDLSAAPPVRALAPDDLPPHEADIQGTLAVLSDPTRHDGWQSVGDRGEVVEA